MVRVVVVGGRDLLGERVVVNGLLEVLPERSYKDICPILPEDVRECIGPLDEPLWRAKLDSLFFTTHYVYIVSVSG